MTRSLHLKAPAKVNFRLDVLRCRPDGYHDLRMIMQRINLCDHIDIALVESPGITVNCNNPDTPDGPENIVWKAADALLRRGDSRQGLNIQITKNIPVAAGLGGGSSDAATTLRGVNKLLGLGLNDRELMKIGLSLGADVPFFIFRKPAIVEGIGEIFTQLEFIPKVWLVLVNPGFHVSTSWVFKNLRLTTEKVTDRIPFLYNSAAELCRTLSNDLEAVTISRFPIIREIKDHLMAAGASGTLMSGSGPTVFGLFTEAAAAQQAASKLSLAPNWFTAAVETI